MFCLSFAKVLFFFKKSNLIEEKRDKFWKIAKIMTSLRSF